MRHMMTMLAGVVLAAAAFFLSCSTERTKSCQDELGCVDIAPGEPIRLGVIQSLSGRVAVLGQEQLRGLQLALAKRGGELLGHKILLSVEDTGCRAEGGANAALKIVSDPSVVAIFGTTCSGDAATAAQVMTEAGLTMISGNNSAPFLTSIGGKRAPKWQPGFFRTAANEEHAGPAAARYAYEALGIRVAATINDGDIYTRGLSEGFAREFEKLGGKVPLSATISKGDTDMRPVIDAVVASKAQLLFFPLFQPEGNHILLQARQAAAMHGVVLMSDGALIEQSFIDAVGPAGTGMYFVGPSQPPRSRLLEELEAEYQAHYGNTPPTSYYISAYDAVSLLFSGIEKAAQKHADGTLRLGRKALRDALYGTKGFSGVTGTLACNEFGDCTSPRFDILRLTDPALGVDGLKANILYTYAP